MYGRHQQMWVRKQKFLPLWKVFVCVEEVDERRPRKSYKLSSIFWPRSLSSSFVVENVINIVFVLLAHLAGIKRLFWRKEQETAAF